MSRAEFALLLMDAWHLGSAGDWARDLALKIQDEIEQEVINDHKKH